MNEGANEALQRQLQALNEKFAERLSEELAALEQHAEQLQSVREQEQRRQLMLDLHERLHRLAGGHLWFHHPGRAVAVARATRRALA